MNEKFIESIFASIVEGNVAIYKELFNEEVNKDNVIDYWKNAMKFYGDIDESQREVFFSIIKTVIIDTISNVFGVIDGVCAIDDKDWSIKMSINGHNTNSELQDVFLAYVELLEKS